MNKFVRAETPGGVILVEVDSGELGGQVELLGAEDKEHGKFSEACASVKKNAKFLLDTLEDLAPSEVEVSCALTAKFDAGNILWGLAKVSTEASYTVKLTWKSDAPDKVNES